MKRLDAPEYERLIDGADVIKTCWHGDKMLKRPDGRMVKIFRPRTGISSSKLDPHARRFRRAARRLTALDIPTVEVVDIYRVPSINRHAAMYEPLEGESLRTVLADGDVEPVLRRFAAFMARLHERGVYFRGLHMLNVLVLPDGDFGLIDVDSAQIRPGPLGPWRRARNFKPLYLYDEDAAHLDTVGLDTFIGWYLHSARLAPRVERRFLGHLGGVNERLADAVGRLPAPARMAVTAPS